MSTPSYPDHFHEITFKSAHEYDGVVHFKTNYRSQKGKGVDVYGNFVRNEIK